MLDINALVQFIVPEASFFLICYISKEKYAKFVKINMYASN